MPVSNNRGRSHGTRRAVAIANAKRKLRRMQIESRMFCGEIAIALHLAEKAVSEGVCPVCGKAFDECEYFKGLDAE